MGQSTESQQIIGAMPAALPTDRRYVIAIAGPPAAGKSTLAQDLQTALAPKAAVLSLDAYHYDNAILAERGAIERKGAPHTFDVDGYRRTLELLRNEPRSAVVIPRFDRQLDLTRGAASQVGPSHSVVITEGNYLLLDETPWTELAGLFDLTVSIQAPLELVQARILARWKSHGLSVDASRGRLEQNDLPNAKLVIERSRPADMTTG